MCQGGRAHQLLMDRVSWDPPGLASSSGCSLVPFIIHSNSKRTFSLVPWVVLANYRTWKRGVGNLEFVAKLQRRVSSLDIPLEMCSKWKQSCETEPYTRGVWLTLGSQCQNRTELLDTQLVPENRRTWEPIMTVPDKFCNPTHLCL